uniref:VOC domain-containing protein n=1 Tax=Takifugu rubripes TaxID=31033 RepID=A0A674MA65_TAKRU
SRFVDTGCSTYFLWPSVSQTVTVGGFRLKTTCQVEASHLDHLVLTVRSVSNTVTFYTTTLGMQVITFKTMGVSFVSCGGAETHFLSPLAQVAAHLKACGFEIKDGPVERTGAVDTITTLYFRDPDHNLIEVSNYMRPSEGS